MYSYIGTGESFYYFTGNFFYVIRERAAVCVAQSKAVRTAAQSRAQTFERVAVAGHTVKEVLRVENDLLAVIFKKAAGLLYHQKVFLGACLQNALDLDFSALSDYRHARSPRPEQGCARGVLFNALALSPR